MKRFDDPEDPTTPKPVAPEPSTNTVDDDSGKPPIPPVKPPDQV